MSTFLVVDLPFCRYYGVDVLTIDILIPTRLRVSVDTTVAKDKDVSETTNSALERL